MRWEFHLVQNISIIAIYRWFGEMTSVTSLSVTLRSPAILCSINDSCLTIDIIAWKDQNENVHIIGNTMYWHISIIYFKMFSLLLTCFLLSCPFSANFNIFNSKFVQRYISIYYCFTIECSRVVTIATTVMNHVMSVYQIPVVRNLVPVQILLDVILDGRQDMRSVN